MPVHRIEAAKARFESIDLLQREFSRADILDAFEHVQQPASRAATLFTQEGRLAPLLKDALPFLHDRVTYNENLAGVRHTRQQDVAADPTGPSRRRRQRLPLLDDLLHEEMFRHDHQVSHAGRDGIVHQHQVRIVRGGQPLRHRAERAIDDPRTESRSLALEFELLVTSCAEQVRDPSIVGEFRETLMPAIGTEGIGARLDTTLPLRWLPFRPLPR